MEQLHCSSILEFQHQQYDYSKHYTLYSIQVGKKIQSITTLTAKNGLLNSYNDRDQYDSMTLKHYSCSPILSIGTGSLRRAFSGFLVGFQISFDILLFVSVHSVIFFRHLNWVVQFQNRILFSFLSITRYQLQS